MNSKNFLTSASNPQPWRLERLSVEAPKPEIPQVSVNPATPEQVAQQAHQQGYAAGFSEGRNAGYQAGQQSAALEVERLQQLLETLDAAVQQAGQTLSVDALALALELAQQMLRQALKVDPALLLPILCNIMETLPQHTQHPHVYLHPEDVVLVRQHMQGEMAAGGWKILEDARIERGGCKVETQTMEIDATLPSRWQRLAAALGQDSDWLAQ